MQDLPDSVRLTTGHGDLPVVQVDGPAGSAEIYLHGATVTRWSPPGAADALWVSEASHFTAGKPIRGGVPICFPWFGALDGQPDAPAHGFARLTTWQLVGAHDDGQYVTLTLRLTDADVAGSPGAACWPYRFEAVYTVVVGARLSLSLAVTNRDDATFTFEEALHTYFAVSDVRTTEVVGLEGHAYLDRLAGPDPVTGDEGPIRFTGETDRIYLGASSGAAVHDAPAGRSVIIAKRGSDATVVWNPWIDKAAAMADFGDDEWMTMVCVEVCNLRSTAVELAPGASHTMTAMYQLSRTD